VNDPDGNTFYSPIISSEALANGSIVFTVTSTVTVFWSLTPGKGIETPPTPQYYTYTLVPNVYPTFTYTNGQWIPPQLSLPPNPSFSWKGQFSFVLATSIYTTQFARWVQQEVKDSSTAVDFALIDRLILLVEGNSDLTDNILALRGKRYHSPLVRTLVEDGVETINGQIVSILSVEIFPFHV